MEGRQGAADEREREKEKEKEREKNWNHYLHNRLGKLWKKKREKKEQLIKEI